MASSMLQDSLQTPILASHPKFRPYASNKHQVVKGRYITSNDPRGYIPVYEYPLNGQWIMMDVDDGYILWTGIWKALGNSKADIVKMLDSQPDLAPLIRRVRGGYLKIQGTWMPYEVALRLSRRVAWAIREDLIPLFGPTFPNTCLSPEQPGYGQVVSAGNSRRRARRPPQDLTTAPQAPREPSNTSWAAGAPHPGISTSNLSHQTSAPDSPSHGYHPYHHSDRYRLPSPILGPSASVTFRDQTPISIDVQYSPYVNYPALPRPSMSTLENSSEQDRIILPPIRDPPTTHEPRNASYALPPISAFEDLRGTLDNDSAAVLRRLRSDHEPSYSQPHSQAFNYEKARPRRNSITHHSYSSTDVSHTSSLPTYHPYHDYQQRTSRPSSRASSSSHKSHRVDYSAVSSTCEPSPVSPRSILSSPGLSYHHRREENASIMTPLTHATDRIHLGFIPGAITPSEYSDSSVRPPLRPW